MNIKSLLLGSAAALVAVSGARAADAIIAEPEPVEYVRICDAYGAGFFYIPGTETCLQISGYVRYQIGTSDAVDGWVKTTRARVNFDARSETEWGTLRGYARFQATWGSPTDGDVLADQAIVQLGGFYAGYTESAFAAPWGAPGIARFGLIPTDTGGIYAYQQRHQLGYTFNGPNGIFGSIVLEDDALSGEGYMPDVVGTLAISQGWGGAWLGVGYDESSSEYGVRAGLQFNIPNMPGSNLRVGGFYASGDIGDVNAYALSQPISGAMVDWSVAVAYTHVFSPSLNATLGVQYLHDVFDEDALYFEGAVVWTPVTNFEVRLEGAYFEEEIVGVDEDGWSGFLRFTRYF